MIKKSESKTKILFLNENNPLLRESLSNLVNGCTMIESGIHFYATSILSLSEYLKEKKYLDYEMTCNMIIGLYKQLTFLEKN